MKTLVLGLGNPIMGDDAVGLRVVQEVRRRLGGSSSIQVEECYAAGVGLLDRIVGYDTLVVVDAVRSGQPRGTLLTPRPEQLPSQPVGIDFHGMGLLGVLRLGERVGLPMPRRVSIVGVAVEGDFEVREGLSPEVERAVSEAAERVLEELRCMNSP
ncbi:MAG: hydrogenase maturation protease [Chloroflexota bacterium]|nr:hydrogenase maturation protease [Chloroflexota bacterium]